MYDIAVQKIDVMKNAAARYPERIQEPFDLLYDHDWFGAIFVLAEVTGGGHLYVPSVRKIFSKCLEAAAKDEYANELPENRSQSKLAKKYGFSETQIRRVLAE